MLLMPMTVLLIMMLMMMMVVIPMMIAMTTIKLVVFRFRFCLPVLNVGEKVSCLSLSYVPPRRISKYPDQIEAIHNEFQGRFKSRRLHKPPIPVGLPFFFVKVSLF